MTLGASLFAVIRRLSATPERGADEKKLVRTWERNCHVHFEASTSVVPDFFHRGRYCRTSARTNRQRRYQDRSYHRHERAAFQRHRPWVGRGGSHGGRGVWLLDQRSAHRNTFGGPTKQAGHPFFHPSPIV